MEAKEQASMAEKDRRWNALVKAGEEDNAAFEEQKQKWEDERVVLEGDRQQLKTVASPPFFSTTALRCPRH